MAAPVPGLKRKK